MPRAKASLCFWPPDKLTPFSIIFDWRPFGSCFNTSVKCAVLQTSRISFTSKGNPRVILCSMVFSKISGSWGNRVIVSAMLATSVFTPSTFTSAPGCASYNPLSNAISVLLPLPLSPISAIRFPLTIWRWISCRLCAFSTIEKVSLCEKFSPLIETDRHFSGNSGASSRRCCFLKSLEMNRAVCTLVSYCTICVYCHAISWNTLVNWVTNPSNATRLPAKKTLPGPVCWYTYPTAVIT